MSDSFICIEMRMKSWYLWGKSYHKKTTGPFVSLSQALGPMAQMAQLLSRRPKIGAMGEVKGEIFRKSEKMGKPWSMQI